MPDLTRITAEKTNQSLLALGANKVSLNECRARRDIERHRLKAGEQDWINAT
jgi:hypothetical protein